MNIPIKMNKDFEKTMAVMQEKYGEDFEYLNGFHESQMNFSDFIDAFVDKNVADVTIDANANASSKDIRSLLNEKGKSIDKMFAFNKIFYEIKKKYGLKTAKEWLEAEYSGAFYMHDAPSSSMLPYCLSGDTRIMTQVGLKRLDELVDAGPIKVLGKTHGWEDATVQKFGVAPLKKIVMHRGSTVKEVRATGNHRWFIKTKHGRDIVTTDMLKPGMKIPTNTSKSWATIKPSPFGIAHGFYTGDGDKGIHQRANFCGDKVALLPYFTPATITGDEREYTTQGIPNYFKELPSITETSQYLFGWLAGYFAADGCVSDDGFCVLTSTVRKNLEFAQDVMCVLGMPVMPIRVQQRVSNLTGELGNVYFLTMPRGYLTDDFFIRPLHKSRIESLPQNDRRDLNWVVDSVTDTGCSEMTYCAVVPGTQSFTLENNVLTHNCYAYDLTRLATEGLFFLKNYNNQPPKHLTTFLDDVIEFVSFMCNRSSGRNCCARLPLFRLISGVSC